MGIRNYIAGKLAAMSDGIKVKADRAAPALGRKYALGNITPAPGTNAALQAERVDSQIAIATRIISATIGELPVRIMQKETIDGEMRLIEDDNHPALEVLRKPTPDASYTSDQIFEHAAQSLVLAGNSYVALESLTKVPGQEPKELWPRQPSQMIVTLDSVTGMKSGYHFGPRVTAGATTYALDEMVHTRLVNLNQDFIGAGRVQPVRSEVMTNFHMNQVFEKFFSQGMITSKMWSPEKDSGAIFGDKQAKELREVLSGEYAGAENAYKLFINSFPGKLENIAEQFDAGQYILPVKMNREKILGTLGIPPMLAGVLEFSSYANALLQERVMWMYTIKPLLRVIQNAWTTQYVQRFWDDDAVLEFDLRNVEALREDELKTTRTVSLAKRSGIMTANEARARIGLPNVDGGDVLVEPSSFSDGNNSDNAKAHGKVLRRLTPAEKRQQALDTLVVKVFDKFQSQTVKALDRMLQKYFKEQRIRIIKKLDILTSKGKSMTNLWLYVNEIKRKGDDDIPFIPDPLFALIAENDALEILSEPIIKEAMLKSGQGFIEESGATGFSFTTANPLINSAAKQFFNRIKLMNDSSYNDLRNLLTNAIANGDTILDVRKQIIAKWNDYSRARAIRIARTEATGIVNRGNLLAYQSTGIAQKKWLATLDSKTRLDHVHADGEVVPVNDNFTRTGFSMSAPGDPSAPAAQTVNCRCAIAPVVDFESDDNE